MDVVIDPPILVQRLHVARQVQQEVGILPLVIRWLDPQPLAQFVGQAPCRRPHGVNHDDPVGHQVVGDHRRGVRRAENWNLHATAIAGRVD